MMKRNISQRLDELRSGNLSAKKFIKHQHVTGDLIKRLKLDRELVGHNGCVNCLEWNDTGELLASGSDDTHIMIWDPFNYVCKADISTNHHGNIFSVKFMPKFNNTKLASGAADFNVKVIDINYETVIDDYQVHMNRVKRLAVCENEPYLLWSCSEDGSICQFDIREDNHKQCSDSAKNVLIDLNNYVDSNAEAKCLAINPVRSYQIAIGSNDPYVRLFDRRKLTLTSPKSKNSRHRRPMNGRGSSVGGDESNDSPLSHPGYNDIVQYFVPGHVPLYSSNNQGKFVPPQFSVTYLTFSSNGSDLLVNMGSEQIYLYDINKSYPTFTYSNSSLAANVAYECRSNLDSLACDYNTVVENNSTFGKFKNSCSYHSNLSDTSTDEQNERNTSGLLQGMGSGTIGNTDDLPPYLNVLKDKGNNKYKEKDFLFAVLCYNIALTNGGNKYARFFANRAAAYISRNWTGDVYAALKDSIHALEIEPHHIKSHFRVAQCLFQLNLTAEAHDYIEFIKHAFPDKASRIKQISELEKKISDRISDYYVKEDKEKSRNAGKSPSNGEIKCQVTHENGVKTSIVDIIAKYSKTRMANELRLLSKDEYKCRRNSNDYQHRYCGHCNTTTDIKEANFFGTDAQYIMAGSDDGNIFFWERETENILRVLCGDSNIVNCLQPHPKICFLASSGIDSVVRLWSPNYCGSLMPTVSSSPRSEKLYSRLSPNRTEEILGNVNIDNDDADTGETTSRQAGSSEQERHSTLFRRSSERCSGDNHVIGKEQNELQAAQSNQERLTIDPFEMVLVNMGLPATIISQTTDEDDDDNDDDDNEEGSNTDENEDGGDEDVNRRSDSMQDAVRRRLRRRRGRRGQIRLDGTEYCRQS